MPLHHKHRAIARQRSHHSLHMMVAGMAHRRPGETDVQTNHQILMAMANRSGVLGSEGTTDHNEQSILDKREAITFE